MLVLVLVLVRMLDQEPKPDLAVHTNPDVSAPIVLLVVSSKSQVGPKILTLQLDLYDHSDAPP